MCGVTETPVRTAARTIALHPRTERSAPLAEEPRNQLEYIEQSKKAHSYSKGVSTLYDLALSYLPDAEKGNQEGRPAVWTTGLMEAPLLYACGTVPMAVYDLGRLTAAEAAAELSEGIFDMPKETCSMVATLLGEWYMRRNNSVKKVVALSTVCEPLNMAYEMIKDFGFDIHRVEQVIRPVHGGDERLDQMVKFLASELEDVAVFLTGKSVDEARMSMEIKRLNRLMAKFRQILKLRVSNPLYLKSLPVLFLLMGSAHYFGKPQEYEAMLDQLIDELTHADFVPSPLGKIVPLTWIGARGLEFGVFKAVDDLGGALLSWFTPNPYDRIWNEDIPPLEAMARFILDYFVTGSPVNQIKYIEKMIAEARSKGMLLLHIRRLPVRGRARRALPGPLPQERGAELVPGGQLASGCAVGAAVDPRARLRARCSLSDDRSRPGYRMGHGVGLYTKGGNDMMNESASNKIQMWFAASGMFAVILYVIGWGVIGMCAPPWIPKASMSAQALMEFYRDHSLRIMVGQTIATFAAGVFMVFSCQVAAQMWQREKGSHVLSMVQLFGGSVLDRERGRLGGRHDVVCPG